MQDVLVTLLLTYLHVHTEWIHLVFTNDTKTQNRCMALVVLSILRTNRATASNVEGEGGIETKRMDTELKDSYSPTSDYKFNTSTMFFHNPAFTFHHITRENIRPLHAGQTEHRRRPSLHETQSGLSGERLKDIEKRLAPAIVVRFSDIRALKFFTLRSQNTQKRSNHFSYIQAESSNTSNLG